MIKKVCQRIQKNCFSIDIHSNTFDVAAGMDFFYAKEIGIELRKIKYRQNRQLELKFNNRLYYFDDIGNMYEREK